MVFEKFKSVCNFTVAYKDSSWLMKLLGKLLFFNKAFMTDYITTIGSTIYFPSTEWVANHSRSGLIEIVAHELVHIRQAQNNQLKFSLLYLFPQILAILSVLCVLWWPALLFLLCLLPLPAYFRKQYEAEAYMVSLCVHKDYLEKKGLSQKEIEFKLQIKAQAINEQFTGSGYWYMWPFGVFDEVPEIACKAEYVDIREVANG